MVEFFIFIAILYSPQGVAVEFASVPMATYEQCREAKDYIEAVSKEAYPDHDIRASCFSSERVGDSV